MPDDLTQQVVLAVDIFYIEDVGQATYLGDTILLAEGLKALICVPLRLREDVVGVLSLGDFVSRTFDREKMKLLSVFASFAAMAIFNATLHNRTKIMAITDALTGLHNHRYFQEILDLELSTGGALLQKRLAVLMIDVDDFKKFNDTYGHPAGDKMLVTIRTCHCAITAENRLCFPLRGGGVHHPSAGSRYRERRPLPQNACGKI